MINIILKVVLYKYAGSSMCHIFPADKSLTKRYLTDIVLKDVKALSKIHLFPNEGRIGLTECQKPSPQRVEGNFRILFRHSHYSLSSRKPQCYKENGHTRLKI